MIHEETHRITDLKIDPEFQNMIPPLTGEEFAQLEENILEDGIVLTPLIVWAGIIVDGHNRYKIIQAHPKLTFSTYEKDFDSRCEALSWICKNQLGRRNLTPQQKKYLIGQRYEAEKRIEKFHGNQHTSSDKSGLGQNDPDHNSHGTRSRIAEETNTTDSYVRRAEYFSQGVNAAEEALPGIKQEILTGSIKPTDAEVAAVAKAPPEERPRMAEQLRVQKVSPVHHPGPPPPANPPGRPCRRFVPSRKIWSVPEARSVRTASLPPWRGR